MARTIKELGHPWNIRYNILELCPGSLTTHLKHEATHHVQQVKLYAQYTSNLIDYKTWKVQYLVQLRVTYLQRCIHEIHKYRKNAEPRDRHFPQWL